MKDQKDKAIRQRIQRQKLKNGKLCACEDGITRGGVIFLKQATIDKHLKSN